MLGLRGLSWAPLMAAMLLLAASMGCTRASIPIEMSEGTLEAALQAEEEGTPGPIDPKKDDFAVVWIPAEEALIVRESAGISSPEAGRLAYDQTGIELTGSSTALGSSQWVEIKTQFGVTGWVPRWNLTEQVAQEGFCRDEAVRDLIAELTAAIESEDSRALQGLLSPTRGLIIRVDLWNPEVRLRTDELPAIFVDPTEIEWGSRFASETPIRGTFADTVAPSLVDVFLSDHEIACNEVMMGRSPEPAQWPPEYENLNFISYHRPAPTDGNTYNWRTWVVAIEYVEGRPMIALLMQIRPQV